VLNDFKYLTQVNDTIQIFKNYPLLLVSLTLVAKSSVLTESSSSIFPPVERGDSCLRPDLQQNSPPVSIKVNYFTQLFGI